MVNSPQFYQSGTLKLLKQQESLPNNMQPSPEYHQLERQIIQTILTVRDSRTLLKTLARQLAEFWQVDFAAISSQALAKTGWWSRTELPKQSVKFLKKLSSDKIIGSLATTESLAIESIEIRDGERALDSLAVNLPIKAFLLITTQFQDNPNGMIILGRSQSFAWTDSDRELLKIISESMAIAISQAQLQQQVQTRSKYHNLLNEITRSIAQTSEVDSILQISLTGIAQTLDVDRGMVLMLKYKDPLLTNASSRKLSTIAARIAYRYRKEDLPPQQSELEDFRLSDSLICQQAFRNAPQPLAIADHAYLVETETESSIDRTLGLFDQQEDRSLLLVPLMGASIHDIPSELVLGFLVLQHSKPRLWQPDELDLVYWIGIQASNAILRSQTLMQVQNLIDRQTSQLRWGLDLKAKLSEKMLQQIQQLQNLNKMKDDFLSSISHELRTPLTTMKMAIEMLRKAGLPETMREKYLNILEAEWGREYNLIKDLLRLQEVESAQFIIHPQELNLQQIFQDLTSSFNQQWMETRGLHLRVDYPADRQIDLYTDAESLESILQELLLNAGKYADADTNINVEVTSKPTLEGKRVIVKITNYGAGIAPDELPYIFDKFRRGQGVTDRAVPGTGLGLALVKYLVQHLQGSIEVTSEAVDDSATFVTCFTLSLPQFPPKVSP
jgi:signal transduction histidine kinase